MKRSLALVALAAGMLGCGGGGGDDKTALRVQIALSQSVPAATVAQATTIRLKLTSGALNDSVDVAVKNSLNDDRETSFRYVDDGRFAGKDVIVDLEVRSPSAKLFGAVETLHFEDGETVDLSFNFGDMTPDGGMGCDPPPTCVRDASRVCIQGTVIDFGMSQVLTNRPVGISVRISNGAMPIVNVPINVCGQFATGSFQPNLPAGDDIELIVDDLDVGTGFVRTVTPMRVVAGDVVTDVQLRVMSTDQNAGLSVQAGFCAVPCPDAMTFAARGAVAVFYRKNGQATAGVRVTRATTATRKPTLLTTDTFYFADNMAGRQTAVSPATMSTLATGTAIAVHGTAVGPVAYGGTGGLGNDAVWVPRVAANKDGQIMVLEPIVSRAETCIPSTQMGCTNEDDGCYPVPSTTGVFCAHAGTGVEAGQCSALEDCSIGLTCDSMGNICQELCTMGSCTSPETCQLISNGSNGVCRP